MVTKLYPSIECKLILPFPLLQGNKDTFGSSELMLSNGLQALQMSQQLQNNL